MKRIYLLLMMVLILVGSATALNVVVTSSNGWVIANQTDSAVITVKVTEGSNAIVGADVVLDITSPWELQNYEGKTDGSGKFETVFLPTKKSGTATITASVTNGGTTVPVVKTLTQNITHDLPAQEEDSYTDAITVGSITEISVIVRDKWGNPVTSKRNKTEVKFSTTKTGDNVFLDGINGKVKEVKVPLNEEGLADADFIVSTTPGENYVAIQPPRPLPMTLVTIQGVSDGKPAGITQKITPDGSPPTVSADGKPGSKFLIEYTLSDSYGNPTAHQDLSISSNVGETKVISSNTQGVVGVSYGPKTGAGMYTITAVAMENPAVKATQEVYFASATPSDMFLTASPQSMASLDVKDDVVSLVMAKVVDTAGNPVQGQPVFFSILSVDTGTYTQPKEPVIKSGNRKTSDLFPTELEAVSDENGVATVEFYPGAFTNSEQAEGTARIQAVWSSVPRSIDLSYKNYPYLSVSTSVEPETIETGGEVNVSIRLRGDGYALFPKPVDVFMVTDRSGSMSQDTPTRISQEKNAATAFTTKFDYTEDRLGQFSFGGKTGTYTDYATLDQRLTKTDSQVRNAISKLTPSGYTPMRYALYKAIDELSGQGRSEAIKALVLMSDGDYNNWGDPLARGTPDKTGRGYDSKYEETIQDYIFFPAIDAEFHDLAYQNMATYAREHNIRIYTIGYATDISDVGKGTLEELATATDGKYFYALSGDQLKDVYDQIATDLKEAAGVGTTMELDFQKVEVNGALMDGDQVFDYVYRDRQSTWMVPPSGDGYTVNSVNDWNDDHRLSFDLGIVKMEEEWVVNFTLRVVKSGNIKVLNSSSASRILFDEGKGSLKIPDTYLTAIPVGTDVGLEGLALKITGLTVTPETDGNTAHLEWYITYNGFDQFIDEEIYYARLNSDYFAYAGTTGEANHYTSEMYPDTYVMDITGLSGVYKVRVIGYVDDADSSSCDGVLTIPDIHQTPVILIQ